MNSKTLRQNSALLALNKYVATTRDRTLAASNSPSLVATMADRDGVRGVYNIQLKNGGTATAKSLTSSGIPNGATIPSAIVGGAGSSVDAKPYR